MANSIQSRITVNTTPSSIELDFGQLEDRMFVGSAAINGAKTITLKNDANAASMVLLVNVTTSATITFPAAFKAESSESRYAADVLTLTGTGQYGVVALFDGTNWLLKATPDGGYV